MGHITQQFLYMYTGQRISAVIISPPPHNIGARDLSTTSFFLPPVILWSPYISYPSMFPSNSILCPSCGQPMKHSHWNDGSTSSTQLRLLHDMDNIVYLVSAVYRCDNQHFLLAHDEAILSSFPTPTMIPFVLLKRTGVTNSLAEMCTLFIIRGLNFHGMESLMIDRRMITFARIADALRNHETLTLGSPKSDIEFWSTELAQSPSDFILKQCFVAAFLRNELLYKRELTAIPVGSAISFDLPFLLITPSRLLPILDTPEKMENGLNSMMLCL